MTTVLLVAMIVALLVAMALAGLWLTACWREHQQTYQPRHRSPSPDSSPLVDHRAATTRSVPNLRHLAQ